MLLLTPYAMTEDAGGAATGQIENAADGLEIQHDGKGRAWAFNTLMDEWQLVHVLKSGDTLWALATKHYGDGNKWKLIRDVPQNKPIVGSSGDKAFAGDTILIPALAQPFAVPGVPSSPSSGSTPTTGGSAPPPWWPAGVPYPGLPMPPEANAPTATPGGPSEAPPAPTAGAGGEPPPGWPEGLPWPPFAVPTPGAPAAETPPAIPGAPGEAPGDIIPAGTTTPAKGEDEEKFWTTGKIAIAGVLAAGAIGLTVYLVTRKRRPSTRRRRRSGRRRRR